MKKVLFLLDKYTSGQPEFGLSNNAHNILDTFQQSVPDAQIYTLFFDESYMYGMHIDNMLLKYCERFKIDIIFISLLGASLVNPSLECINSIKNLGLKIIFIWCDNNPTEIFLQDAVSEISDLNIILDYPTSDLHNTRRELHKRSGKYLYLWTPESKFLYYPDKHNINVSFIGSIRYEDRLGYINKLRKEFPDVYIRGGQRESYLSPEGYASLIRKSSININFSKNPNGYRQVKGRVFETTASNTLLLEEENESTLNFFNGSTNYTSNLEYVTFSDADDLIEKVIFFLKNPDIKEKIALNGYNKFKNNWTAYHFWSIIMKKINEL